MVDSDDMLSFPPEDKAVGERAMRANATKAEPAVESGRYATYRRALFYAGVLNVLGAVFAKLPKDAGGMLRQLAILSLWFWALTAIYVAIRRRPTIGERFLIGVFPLLIVLWLVFG